MAKPNSNIDLQSIIRAEYVKCARDPIYFFKKYVKIQHPTRGTVAFDTYPYQDETLNDLIKYRKNLILKSRQMGITTLLAVYALWLMSFFKDKEVICYSITKETSIEIINKLKFANEHLPTWLRRPNLENNKTSMRFDNNSRIRAVSSAGSSGRGSAISLLIMDEAAFIKNAEELWVSSQPSLSTGGRAVILSTPFGVGNLFHKLWSDAEQGNDEFHRISLPWHRHPERDQKWRDDQTAILGEKGAAQECDCQFNSSGNTVVSLQMIELYESLYKCDPIRKAWSDFLWIFKEAEADRRYLVCADVGRGDGKDYSAAHVIDLDTLEQVAEFKGKLPTKEYGRKLVALATEYNSAILAIENQSIGWATIQEVIDIGYPNLYYTLDDVQYIDDDIKSQQAKSMFSSNKKTAGVITSHKTRPLMVEKLSQYILSKSVIIHSSRTFDELRVFVWKITAATSRAEALSGYNDDLVMSLAIGYWLRDTAIKLQTENDAYARLLVDKIGGITKNPFGTNNLGAAFNGVSSNARNIMKQKAHDQWNVSNTAYGRDTDLTWLIR